MESMPEPETQVNADEDAICHRMVLVCGTSTGHMDISGNKLFIPGVWGPYWSAMVPEYWLTEGGQSATGALLDHLLENHVAALLLANRAASQRKSVFELLNKILESMVHELKILFFSALTEDTHVLPDFHGNSLQAPHIALQRLIMNVKHDTIFFQDRKADEFIGECRQYVLPKFFHLHHLWELDAAEYEEIAGVPHRERNLSFKDQDRTQLGSDEGIVDVCDAEILDELTTSRGELKHRYLSFNEDRALQDLQVHPEINPQRA